MESIFEIGILIQDEHPMQPEDILQVQPGALACVIMLIAGHKMH